MSLLFHKVFMKLDKQTPYLKCPNRNAAYIYKSLLVGPLSKTAELQNQNQSWIWDWSLLKKRLCLLKLKSLKKRKKKLIWNWDLRMKSGKTRNCTRKFLTLRKPHFLFRTNSWVYIWWVNDNKQLPLLYSLLVSFQNKIHAKCNI